MLIPRLVRALLIPALCLSLLPTASAQKLNSRYRQFPAIGMEFKAFKDMSDVPVNDRMQSRGIIAQGKAERGPYVKSSEGDRFPYTPNLFVFYDQPQGPLTGEGSDTKQPESYKARTAEDYADAVLPGASFKQAEKTEEEFTSSKKVEGQMTRFVTTMLMQRGGNVPIHIDVYTFFDGQSKLVFVWDYPCEDRKDVKKWGGTIEKAMKSVRYIRKAEEMEELDEVNSESSYEDLLAYHRRDVEQTPGWDLIETPSKNYLIKTNSEDRKDLKEVIQRLEASRRLYEEDFPPPAPITSISVVRICNTRAEFGTYGQTGGGVAGYFSPGSEELVLFFGDGSIDETLGVMTHEAFHQYCHFLFNRSEAHRWFDEGHGDYYGAWEMKGKNLKPNKDMRGGLARLPHLKELYRENRLAPLSKHIRFDHRSWQSQGPQNISNYCQSFSLIYFLREGARRKVSKRYWEPEYADIIPNYIKSLSEGYNAVYDSIVKDATEALAKLEEQIDAGKEVDDDMVEALEARIARPWDFFFGVGDKQAIWDKAMADSWGKIDEAEFEEHWLEYIDKEL